MWVGKDKELGFIGAQVLVGVGGGDSQVATGRSLPKTQPLD